VLVLIPINKLNRGDNVTTDVLVRICKTLNCNIGDIMDIMDVIDNTDNNSQN
jgi:DNA-binding Xre family transcriptional regulator